MSVLTLQHAIVKYTHVKKKRHKEMNTFHKESRHIAVILRKLGGYLLWKTSLSHSKPLENSLSHSKPFFKFSFTLSNGCFGFTIGCFFFVTNIYSTVTLTIGCVVPVSRYKLLVRLWNLKWQLYWFCQIYHWLGCNKNKKLWSLFLVFEECMILILDFI